jgi:hypothetical protein
MPTGPRKVQAPHRTRNPGFPDVHGAALLVMICYARRNSSRKRMHMLFDRSTRTASLFALAASLESWYGLFAPAGTPRDVIYRLNKSAAAVQSEAFKKLAVNEGLVMVAGPPEAFDRYFRSEEERWRKVIQDAGIKAE